VYHRRSWKVARILLTEGRGEFWKLQELVAKNSEAQMGCPVTYTYTRREGRELLERHGFRATDVRVEHIFRTAPPTTSSISTSKSGIFVGCRSRCSARSNCDWACISVSRVRRSITLSTSAAL
jgi:hypothetical protein